jgi:hypothetical protein
MKIPLGETLDALGWVAVLAAPCQISATMAQTSKPQIA